MSRRPGRLDTAAGTAVLVLLVAALAGGALGAPPTAGPAARGRPGAPVADRPDTARLEFTAADSLPGPVALHALADSVSFGGVLAVAWDLPAGAIAAPAGLPRPAGDRLVAVEPGKRRWWRFGGADRGGDGDVAAALEALPPAAGQRLVARYRVYTTDPFRLAWAGRTSGVVTVHGRVQDPDRLASVRDPRRWGWFTTGLGLLLAGLALLAALAWWWWRRRRRGEGPADWALPEPAWIGAALALQDLLAERRLERGEPRAFLDGLAAVARRFAAAHYGVPAAELTGGELKAACAARGYEAGQPAAIARLIDGADLRRYDPASPAPGWCREQAAELVARLAASRVLPRQTPVAADRLLAAQKAWAAVSAALAPGAGSGAVAGGGKGAR